MRVEDDEKSQAWWPRLHSFSVGLKDSPDLIAARKVRAVRPSCACHVSPWAGAILLSRYW
jgi:hypothetical protein